MDAIKQAARAALGRIDRALASAGAAERLREGFVVVIAGPPNVGKSTLMNALAGREVAITSPFAGTTRDLIEVFLDLRGYPVTLVDTAGIRDSADPIEQEGVARARRRAEQRRSDPVAGRRPRRIKRRSWDGQTLSVRTKIDLGEAGAWLCGRGAIRHIGENGRGRSISCLTPSADLAEERMASREPAVLTLERHRRAFQDARDALASALGPEAAERELIAEDLRRAAAAMDRVVGRIGVEDVLGEIFSRLCVGK